MSIKSRKILIFAALFIILLAAVGGGAIADRLWGFKPLDKLFPKTGFRVDTRILTEESVVIKVAEDVSPSVVTVSVETPERRILEFSPFGGFTQRIQGGEPQDIGTGFIVSADGLIVTNKHVVSVTDASYKVIGKDNKEYEVKEISRDPSNDIAILKIEATGLVPVELGDSSNLKAGQFVIAIGTALGEFRHTVTTGVISGLGRGITAGSAFEGYVERLDDVIQTDAAINPGNSGGPLLNSAGQVIGVNVAVAQGAQNIGFAIPIERAKQALEEIKKYGRIRRPFLGIRYLILNPGLKARFHLPLEKGALIVNEGVPGDEAVIAGSPAEKAGLKEFDVIVSCNQKPITEKETLEDILSEFQVGDKISIRVLRQGKEFDAEFILQEFKSV
ncbi:MAG: protease Do [Candidatus Woesebacteria bacterium GW2011_GWF2_46_8]|uniref:Protease Do n=1 Tax=Candidatus Woesebacteria bacterium GW2011_GWF2_46_8 TaxID=1618604 RepID=A0A0G1QSM6_9BACT|nr:MAG: protease Do [Candidatus Woesebacteria bacterium GW2011_GWF2_46_8]